MAVLVVGVPTLAEAAPVRGDIVSITSATPSWFDAPVVEIANTGEEAWLQVECGDPFGPVYHRSHYRVAGQTPAPFNLTSVTVTLEPDGSPVAADCLLTLTGSNVTPSGKFVFKVTDTLAFQVSP